MRFFSAHDAKQKFGQILETAKTKPAAITRYKKTVAVVISADDFAELTTLRQWAQRRELSKLLDEIEQAADIRVADHLSRKLLASLKNFIMTR